MPENEFELKQMELGLFTTRDITLATSLMCSDYPGVTLYKVEADTEWRRDDKPMCTFHLSVEDPEVIEEAMGAFQANKPRGLPVANTGEYDQGKKQLIEGMRTARALVVQNSAPRR